MDISVPVALFARATSRAWVTRYERTHSSSQNLRHDLPGAASRHSFNSVGGVSGFSMAAQHDRRDDDRYHQGDVRCALLHARALQHTTDMGDCGVCLVLDGDTVRANFCRLLVSRLATSRLLIIPRAAASFPELRSIVYKLGSLSESWRQKF